MARRLRFSFGLPREAVVDLGWPCNWPDLVQYCKKIGRTEFRAALDRHREARPSGDRYAHRATDRPARSHSPLKLVNPPVGLMYLEGAPRLLDAAVTIPGMIQGDPERIAVEAYPGFVARAIDRRSYKSDTRARQSPLGRPSAGTSSTPWSAASIPSGWLFASIRRPARC